MRERRSGVVALVLAVALVATACSDEGGDDPASEPPTEATSEAMDSPSPDPSPAASSEPGEPSAGALGEPNPATGDPVVVGVAYPDGALASLPEVAEGARAAASYANDHLGGLGGRPIELLTCGTDESDPVSGRDCANDFVAAGAVAVVVGATSLGNEMVPIVTEAGIPYVVSAGVSIGELTTPGAFSLTAGFPASMAALALDARQAGYEAVTLFVANLPGATQGAEGIARPIFDGLAIGFEIVPVDLGTPDLGPQVTAALSGGTDAMAIAGDVTLCAAFFNAYAAAEADVPVHAVSTCFGPGIETLVPEGVLDGVIVYAGIDSAGDGEEAALFRDVLAAYAPDTGPNGFSASAYQALLTVVRTNTELEGEVTAAAVADGLVQNEVPAPVGEGLVLKCDGSAIPMLPAVCTGDYLRAVVSGTTPQGHQVVPTGALFQAGAG